MTEKISLADFENELQRGHRTLKMFERALEMVELLKSSDFDLRKSQKKLDDFNADAEKRMNAVNQDIEAAVKKSISITEQNALSLAQGEKILKDAELAGERYMDGLKKAAEAHRASINNELRSTVLNLDAKKEELMAVSEELVFLKKSIEAATAELDGMKKAKADFVASLTG